MGISECARKDVYKAFVKSEKNIEQTLSYLRERGFVSSYREIVLAIEEEKHSMLKGYNHEFGSRQKCSPEEKAELVEAYFLHERNASATASAMPFKVSSVTVAKIGREFGIEPSLKLKNEKNVKITTMPNSNIWKHIMGKNFRRVEK
ncbi:MAG: hypothetical protein NT120_02680 [Candidatus Aenigmarchaeota archaeon]|nr:hypothetical protein [Candidatus Aenigmarchaeota archaeon]